MVMLTPEQQQALLESGSEPLRLTDPQNGVVYLLIPQADYERFQNLANALKELRPVNNDPGEVNEGFEAKRQAVGISENWSNSRAEPTGWSVDLQDRSRLIAEPLSFQGRLNLTDVLNIARYRSFLIVDKPVRVLMKGFVAFLIVLCLITMGFSSPGKPLLLFILFLCILVFFVPAILRYDVKKKYRQSEDGYLESRVVLTQDRIYIENAAHRSDHVWGLIGVICSTPEGLMFCDPNFQVRFWLPQRLFDGNDLRDQVLQLARDNNVCVRWMD